MCVEHWDEKMNMMCIVKKNEIVESQNWSYN